MHVLFRESHGLEEAATPQDLGQTPADLVVLSFSDSDLGAFAAGWQRGRDSLPGLRLARLGDLRHPLSVDTWLESVGAKVRGILVRLIGGKSYWSYGLEQLSWFARKNGIALAVLSGDGSHDPVLEAASTLPVSTLRRLSDLCKAGGEIAAQAAIAQLALASGLYAGPVAGLKSLPNHGFWHPASGASVDPERSAAPLILIPFYRAWAAAGDTASIAALIQAFEAKGYRATGVFLPSLKDPAARAWLHDVLPGLGPCAILNATAFSGQEAGEPSPLDHAGVPVFQVIHATSTRGAWEMSDKGLSAADLAMYVALPELDGRILAGVVSFKETLPSDADLQISLMRHCPAPKELAQAVARVVAHLALRVSQQPSCFVLSNYPGKIWRISHAVGLDVMASLSAMLEDLGSPLSAAECHRALRATRLHWPVQNYLSALATLPAALQADLAAAHGAVWDDPIIQNDCFEFSGFWHGGHLIALQPERGSTAHREGDYHDLRRPPAHGYVAFYLWLKHQIGPKALVHIGAHGTLEWLPGKAVALGSDCWPAALTGDLPVLYPFIVSDPGEAAQARRRLGALTLGHLPPPQAQSQMPANFLRLEQLLDEYSNAEGLDPARRLRLIPQIRAEAGIQGLDASLDITEQTEEIAALSAIDAFVCDLKESQFAAGLHIWGRGCPDLTHTLQGDPASLLSEREALLRALGGQRIEAGPSGSPWRGRLDVLPTGRNLYGIDPRATPSPSAWAQGRGLADALIHRHLQDHGDYPKSLMINLWGSATMRTAGEDFAMALHLAGLKPIWDPASARVTGFEVTALTQLGRPRIEVSLRISGLFRDTFPELVTLFAHGCKALAARDEAADMNPYCAAPEDIRVFGPAAGTYGAGQMPDLHAAAEDAKAQAAAAWLQASGYGADGSPKHAALKAQIQRVDSFVLTQDLPESDLLIAEDYASHIGGFAAAAWTLGAMPNLYHLDTTQAGGPKARPLSAELARITYARASQGHWLAAMQNHGPRGAAEIAATLEHLVAFAHLTDAVPAHLLTAYRAATLDDPKVAAFMAEENPEALRVMEELFATLDKNPTPARSNSGQAIVATGVADGD